MPFPQRLLAEDEEVVLDLHPHWKQLLLPIALIPIVIGLVTYVIFVVPSGSAQAPLRIAVGAIAAFVLIRFSIWPFLKWQTTRYVLTTRRIVIRQGVFGRSGRDVPLTRVNDVSFHHSMLERMLRCGTLTVESAGEHGQIVLPGVPRVETVQREVYRCAEAEVRRQGGHWRESPAVEG